MKQINWAKDIIDIMCNVNDLYDEGMVIALIKVFKNQDSQELINRLLTEINNIDNLVALCKTHHWELDNGYLVIEN